MGLGAIILGEKMIDRYNCEYCNIIGENDMCESKDGEWVRYEDIKHLLQNTSSNSDYAKLKEALESIADCGGCLTGEDAQDMKPVSYTHLRAPETVLDLVCRLLLEKK